MDIRKRRYKRQKEEFLKQCSTVLKKVSQFKYLGIMITQSNNMEYEILKWIILMDVTVISSSVTYLYQENV